MTTDDEILLARFIDGDMDEGEAEAFAARIEAEPDLAAALDRWQANDRLVAQGLDAILAASPARPAAEAPVDLAAFRAARAQAAAAPQRRRWLVPTALAASLAVAGLFSLSVLREAQSSPLGALDTLPAGQSVALADGGELTAVLTFAAGDGRWCREYAIAGQGSGIACREDGAWQAQGALAGSGDAPGDPAAGYATAAGADPAALDAVYASLDAGDPLGAEDEAALLQSGWTRPAR